MTDLTKTITYYYIKENTRFKTDKERNDFIKYCEYMMFSNYEKPYPIPEEDVLDYFRGLYKAVEMMYEEDVLEQYYQDKEDDEMKYYEDYFNSEDYFEDLYSQYYFKSNIINN